MVEKFIFFLYYYLEINVHIHRLLKLLLIKKSFGKTKLKSRSGFSPILNLYQKAILTLLFPQMSLTPIRVFFFSKRGDKRKSVGVLDDLR